VKFRLGSPSNLGDKVTSGLVWRFDTFDYISDNLACFEDGFGNNGSFLDVGGHHCRGISCHKNTGYHTTDPKI
jgi:hypothetical protein